MLAFWIDSPAALLGLDAVPPDHPVPDPVPQDPADDGGHGHPGDEDEQGRG